jgi:hypothetical protein
MKSSKTQSACQHLNIANSQIGEVMICPDCGVVHVSMQSVSMRFELSAFAELAKMITQAQVTIEQAKVYTQEQRSPEASHQFH